MFGLTSLLHNIPDDFKPMAALGIGAVILVGLVLFHGAGIHRIIVWHLKGEGRLLSGRPHLIAASLLFGWAVFLLLCLHIAEIIAWAFLLTRMGLIQRVQDSIYFCANAYTTIGYGQDALEMQWRNISPIIAFSGLFTFAWTTSVLVDLVRAHRQLVTQLQEERSRELELRTSLRKDELDALVREREAEHEERERTRKTAASTSFFARRKDWREERKKIRELRKAKLAEIDTLRRKERSGEEKLGPGMPPKDSAGKK